jgi:hypothetical protein
MKTIESVSHWRLWAVGIVLALLISLFALNQFHLLGFTPTLVLGCLVLFLSMIWNGYVIKLNQGGAEPGWQGGLADGLLLAGLMLVFFSVFF